MQKINRSSSRISELIENPKPSTHKRKLFSRSALGMTGTHYLIVKTAPFARLRRFSSPLRMIPAVFEDTGGLDKTLSAAI
jgi:hypothetical protein